MFSGLHCWQCWLINTKNNKYNFSTVTGLNAALIITVYFSCWNEP